MIMNASSLNIVSIKDIDCKFCKLMTALEIDGATRALTEKESRQYFKPFPEPL